MTLARIQQGHLGGDRGTGARAAAAAPPLSPEDAELSLWEAIHARTGEEPPTIKFTANDAAYTGAHTLERHGPDIPLRRDPGRKTIEGRIYKDYGWDKWASGSFKWNDHTTLHRTVNDYVQNNWERIRSNLAVNGEHEDVFDAGHAIGEGFVNAGMFGAGPRQAQYSVTSTVRIVIQLDLGTDPPQPFIVTAFPTGLG
ncbi:hypothetical protein [Paractinoplanes ferrugineus]|uniref:hypothetical protein n=1 Tax=Paractinoplanes ferrugineus TaxID=113564 RepID=UPI0019427C32|nr:hypothetical protein [Actinoplanes ferrugineus]